MKKFELTTESKEINGKTVYRIRSLIDFKGIVAVKRECLGGFIEKEENLSQEGNCWIFDDSAVYGNARVHDNAILQCRAEVYGNSKIHGRAIISGSEIRDDANICDAAVFNSTIYQNANIEGVLFIPFGTYGKNCNIRSSNDFLYINIRGNHFSFYRTIDTKIRVCYESPKSKLSFSGFIDDLEEFAKVCEIYDIFIESTIKFAKETLKFNR